MKFKSIKNKNYNLELINVDNFRSCHFALIFRSAFNEKDAVAFSMLSDLLTDASKEYPSSKYIVRHLQESYILDFYGSFSRNGKVMQTYIVCDYIDPKYIKDENYLDNTYKFIFDVLKKTLVDNNKFDENLFSIVKKRTIAAVKRLKEDNSFMSIHNALHTFAPSSPTSFHMYDMLDFIENLTSEDLYKYYLKLINNSSIDIFVTGNIDEKKVSSIIKKNFPFKESTYKEYSELIYHDEKKIPKKKIEKTSFKQSCVVMIYNVNNMSMYEREFVMPYYINIINRGGLHTKLYKYLREENSLCYNVNTSCYDRSNILVIKSTIKVKEEKKAIKLIKKAVKEMKSDIKSNEFIGAYYQYQSSLKGMVDSIGAINRLYMNKYYAGFSDYEEKQKTFKKVSVEDVYNLASKIKLNTIYIAKGDINERNQD